MVRNITLSAEEFLIEKARERAVREKKTLNAAFREWLKRYVNQEKNSKNYKHVMKKLSYADPGKSFSREEMNER